VPVIATTGVDAVIRRDDALKEEILRPMFGDEWPKERVFPNRTVSDGETLELGGARFTVLDLGPGESPHDSIWLLGDDRRIVFLGDQVYDHKHAYLADGFYEEWLANLERLRQELPADATLHVGHGGSVTPAHFDWQREYVETFLDAVRSADWSQPDVARAAVVERMTRLLPTDELRFLMELSIEPVASSLGIVTMAHERSAPG
jgi:glyoxylase-like metal-dependent hydrolase (beta-lactamase superfamily II)